MKNRNRLAICMLVLAVCAFGIPAMAQRTTTGIDCSQIAALHLLQQDNQRAGLTLIECGIVKGGEPEAGSGVDYPAPPNILVSNRSCTSSSTCTKSENMVWENGSTVVVNYNDHNTAQSNTYGGISYSTDGGATFTEIEPDPLATGHSQNYGDPIVVFNKKLNMWFAGDLVTGCGGQGIGLWTSPDGINWSVGACAHNSGEDDRESFWVDNDPTSAGYGRMYISFGNYEVGSGALQVVYSDNGTSWTLVTVSNTSTFYRDVQITGAQVSPTANRAALKGYNTVILASMDEGGGGLATRQNLIWHSNNGGASWTSAITGPRFAAVGDGTCPSNSYFARINPIWRHMGWGEPAVGPNNVIHYVYAAHGQGSDNGDIFYVRSTDGGATWSTPLLLNTDTPGVQYHTQWMPNLSVNAAGKVTASWYDRRSVSSACNSATDPGCNYERYARQSSDNGNTWGASDFAVSTAIIPQPQQTDSGVQSCYAGDYDYSTAQGGSAYVTWTDGRRNVGGINVQDVNLAVVPEQ
ncbi:MAG: hypothetical protein WAM71_05920 [Candidatus Korobacteraceae bacterium]